MYPTHGRNPFSKVHRVCIVKQTEKCSSNCIEASQYVLFMYHRAVEQFNCVLATKSGLTYSSSLRRQRKRRAYVTRTQNNRKATVDKRTGTAATSRSIRWLVVMATSGRSGCHGDFKLILFASEVCLLVDTTGRPTLSLKGEHML